MHFCFCLNVSGNFFLPQGGSCEFFLKFIFTELLKRCMSKTFFRIYYHDL